MQEVEEKIGNRIFVSNAFPVSVILIENRPSQTRKNPIPVHLNWFIMWPITFQYSPSTKTDCGSSIG